MIRFIAAPRGKWVGLACCASETLNNPFARHPRAGRDEGGFQSFPNPPQRDGVSRIRPITSAVGSDRGHVACLPSTAAKKPK